MIGPPAFADMRMIYLGPHLDDHGVFDPRIFFNFFCGWNDDGAAIWIVFPYGAQEDEIQELVLHPDKWTDSHT